jgi:hypothetical protein
VSDVLNSDRILEPEFGAFKAGTHDDLATALGLALSICIGRDEGK